MSLPWPEHYSPDDVAKRATQAGVVAVHVDDLKRWMTQIQDAFDLGFKAAGGAMIPDGASDMVEVALSRDEITALCDAMTMAENECRMSPAEEALLSSVREKISLFERKK